MHCKHDQCSDSHDTTAPHSLTTQPGSSVPAQYYLNWIWNRRAPCCTEARPECRPSSVWVRLWPFSSNCAHRLRHPHTIMRALRNIIRSQTLAHAETLLAASDRSVGRSASGSLCSTSYSTSAVGSQAETQHSQRWPWPAACVSFAWLFRCLSVHEWQRVIRQSWRPYLQSAAVVAAAAAAGCVGTARADEVATIHPEAKVCWPSTVRWHVTTSTSLLLHRVLSCDAVLANSAIVHKATDVLQVWKADQGPQWAWQDLWILCNRDKRRRFKVCSIWLAWLCSGSYCTDNCTCDIASSASKMFPLPCPEQAKTLLCNSLCMEQHSLQKTSKGWIVTID